jgi:thiamine kinase-like enzyme
MSPESIAHAVVPEPKPATARADDPRRTDLLQRLGLETDSALSDDGDSFVTLLCRDEAGRRVVLKYVHSGSADAYRRLRNETLLFKRLQTRPPLRLLPHRADGDGYLVTDYDPGTLLWPDRFDDRVAATIARALHQFQTVEPDVRPFGVVDRERLTTYYLKVLTKHLLHLWPAHISARDAAHSLAIVTSALPAIHSRRVICHGDLLPTNLLYNADDGSITFTDLEGFMCGNHPLFDVMAFFSISGRPLQDWSWQRLFLAEYLRAGGATLALDPSSKEYRDAYRGILVFFLVYRLNEARNLLTGSSYFENLGKRRFVARKAVGLATGRREIWRDDQVGAGLDVRKENLRRALSQTGFNEHLEAMHASLGACR